MAAQPLLPGTLWPQKTDIRGTMNIRRKLNTEIERVIFSISLNFKDESALRLYHPEIGHSYTEMGFRELRRRTLRKIKNADRKRNSSKNK